MRSLALRAYPISKLPCLWAWASWQRSMGGGPRTFPGGVTKWQWKRMQVKKREEADKRRLARERELYEMRQRAEVIATHPELQQPWEKLARFPPPGITPQQQIAGLIRRFNKPTYAEDLWDQKDGPQKCPSEHAVEVEMIAGVADSSPVRSRYTADIKKPKKKKEVSPIGKNMQDYLDSFETDPLGLAVENTTATSLKERLRDPLGLASDSTTPSKGRRR